MASSPDGCYVASGCKVREGECVHVRRGVGGRVCACKKGCGRRVYACEKGCGRESVCM